MADFDYSEFSWDDGVHVLHETKRYRRKKIEESQLSLFSDEDFK